MSYYEADEAFAASESPEDGKATELATPVVIRRKDAREQGLKRYFTGEPCKRGHIAERLVSSRECLECARECQRAYRETNFEQWREYQRAYYVANCEKIREQWRNWWRARDEADRAKAREWCRTSEARKLNATPPWADREAILAVYIEAERLTRETGILHHVDHIIPLQHPRVCGLHIAENLRAIPASENLAKGNRWEG